MSVLRAWFTRLSGMFGKERRDQELDVEMTSHRCAHVCERKASYLAARRPEVVQ